MTSNTAPLVRNPMQNNAPAAADAAISSDAGSPLALLNHCPRHQTTPLIDEKELANQLGLEKLWIKDESKRMGLGSFKALGASYVLALMAMEKVTSQGLAIDKALDGQVFIAASAGNHGLSLAAGARLFGASARIYLSDSVPESFAQRLRDIGAEVVRHGTIYEESMTAAMAAAAAGDGTLISDSSWEGYTDVPRLIMEGYLVSSAEVTDSLDAGGISPTHIFLQAGVGGFAAAMARWFRKYYNDNVKIILVEPDEARPLYVSLLAGVMTSSPGEVSIMGRLDCKDASLLAFAGLSNDVDFAMTITETESADAVTMLADVPLATTPSGAAGFAGLAYLSAAEREMLGIDKSSRVLVFMTEGDD